MYCRATRLINMKKTAIVIAAAATLVLLAATTLILNLRFSSAITDNATSTSFQITITGQVVTRLNLSLADLQSMPSTSETATIYCVESPELVVTQGNWTGVRLAYLLLESGISPAATKVVFRASDGYSTDLALQRALQDDVVLAYEKDGAPLPEIVRLVVPGNWGYKWISKITTIELVNYDYLGKWESAGYPDDAIIGSPINENIPGLINFPTVPPKPTQTPTPALTTQASAVPSPATSESSPQISGTPPAPSTGETPDAVATSTLTSPVAEAPEGSVIPYAAALLVILVIVVADVVMRRVRRRRS